MRGDALFGPLRPGIDLRRRLALREPREQGAALIEIVDDDFANGVEADAVGPFVDALAIARLLAIKLRQGGNHLDALILGRNLGEQLRALDMQPRRPGIDDLIARIDADHADILARRLGAIARTAAHRQLDLRRRPRAPEKLLQLDPEPGRILRAEPAPFRADAGLHRAQSLAIGVTRDHAGLVEIAPYRRQVFLLDAQKVDALPARHLHGRDLELVRDIGNRAQLARRRHAAPHARHHGEGAVLLDIGVNALVDEARLRVVFVFAGPSREQIIVERRAADMAAVRARPFHEIHHRPHALQLLSDDHPPHVVMAEARAGTHRLDLRRLRIIADGGGQNLLDQRRAGAARRGSLGMRPHVLHSKQLLLRNRLDDGPFADPVAAADLRAVRHGGDLVRPRAGGLLRLAKHQPIPDAADIRALAQQPEIPGPIGRIAIEHRAEQLVVLQDEPLIDPRARVMQHDLLAVGLGGEVPGREQIDARHFQLGRDLRAFVTREAAHRQMIGADLGLVEQRRHQPISLLPMLHAFADRIDAPVEGLHRIGDDNAAFAMQPRLLGKLRIRPDPDRHHDNICGNLRAVREAHARHMRLAQNRLRRRRHLELEPARLQRSLQHVAGGLVELSLHQGVDEMNDRHLHPALHQPIGRFQPEQPAADHHSPTAARGRRQHQIDVVNVAIGDDAFERLARHRQHDRVRPRRDQQPVIGHALAGRGDDLAGAPVDHRNRLALAQLHIVVAVPVFRVEDDLLDRLLARQHRRQQDAVVIDVRLGPEHRDLIKVRGAFDQMLQRANARHAVADDDESLFGREVEHDRLLRRARRTPRPRSCASAP